MRIARFAFFCLASLLLASSALGQKPGVAGGNARAWVQLAKLSTLDPLAIHMGNSIAISGNVVVVGTQYGHEAQVYVMPPGGWSNLANSTAQLKVSNEPACGSFGYSVAISGNTIVVGDPQSNCLRTPGAAYVFVEPAGGWTGTISQTAKLMASDATKGDGVGDSVAINGDTIVVGAPFQSNHIGAAYVYTKPATGWANATQTAKLTPSDGQANEDFGMAVSTSGNAVAASSPYQPAGTTNSGAVYVYVRPAAGWMNSTQTAKLTAGDTLPYGPLGISLSMSGPVIAAGASGSTVGSNQGQGAAYVFVEPENGWVNATQTAKLTALGGYADDELGASVSVSDAYIVAGAPWFSHSANDITSPFFHEGADYIFTKPSSGWTSETQSAMVTGSDARLGAYLGSSVATSGNAVASGAVFNNQNSGAAYIFSSYTPQ